MVIFENSTAWRLERIPGECTIKSTAWQFTEIWEGNSLPRSIERSAYWTWNETLGVLAHQRLWFTKRGKLLYILEQILAKKTAITTSKTIQMHNSNHH
jgi:hypothetical protein